MRIKHSYQPLFYNLVNKKIASYEALLWVTNNGRPMKPERCVAAK